SRPSGSVTVVPLERCIGPASSAQNCMASRTIHRAVWGKENMSVRSNGESQLTISGSTPSYRDQSATLRPASVTEAALAPTRATQVRGRSSVAATSRRRRNEPSWMYRNGMDIGEISDHVSDVRYDPKYSVRS